MLQDQKGKNSCAAKIREAFNFSKEQMLVGCGIYRLERPPYDVQEEHTAEDRNHASLFFSARAL